MAWSLRSSCAAAALVTGAVFTGGVPATAQFFNPFEALFGPPPRPPSTVPSGRQQAPPASYPQYQDPRYDQGNQGQPYPNEANVPRRPPPPGFSPSRCLRPPAVPQHRSTRFYRYPAANSRRAARLNRQTHRHSRATR